MIKRVQGVVVHGKTIEFDEDLGLIDGQKVDVTVAMWRPSEITWGEGLKRCAGALAASWSEEDDRILEQIYLDRKSDARAEVPVAFAGTAVRAIST